MVTPKVFRINTLTLKSPPTAVIMPFKFSATTNAVFASYPWYNDNLDDDCNQQFMVIVKGQSASAILMSFIQHKLRALILTSESLSNNLNPNDHFIRGKLNLQHDPDAAGTGPVREYAFVLFILRYRLVDIGLWLSKGGPPSKTIIPRSPFPETKSLVRMSHFVLNPILI